VACHHSPGPLETSFHDVKGAHIPDITGRLAPSAGTDNPLIVGNIRAIAMIWDKPVFEEIQLCCEINSYAAAAFTGL